MTSAPIKIVLLLQDLDFGGTQRYAVQLLKHLDRELFDPQLWVMRGSSDMAEEALAAGAPVTWLSQSSWVGPRALFVLLWKLLFERPTVLYTMTVIPNIWGRSFGALVRIPLIVCSCQNTVADQHESLLSPFSARLICNAEEVRRVMIAKHDLPEHKVVVVPNAIDADFFQPAPELRDPRPTVVTIGRLVEQKDHENLLEAFRTTLDRVPDARLLIVGNGPLKESIEQSVRRHGLESSVELHPGTADVRPYLHRAWLFALSSGWEGSPNVLFEAMACGVPIVSTSVGGVPELIEDGRSGKLVPAHDARALSAAMTDVLLNGDLRESLGVAARTRILEHFTMEQLARRTEKVLLDALKEREDGKPRGFER